jgi:hypothetical protein
MKRVVFLLALVAFAMAPMAMADSITLTNGGSSITTNYGGSGSFTTATASITWSLSGNQLTLVITNTSVVAPPLTSTAVTGVAFSTTPNIKWTIASQSGGITGWSSPGGAGDGTFEVRLGNAGACGSTGALCPGQSGTIVFNLKNSNNTTFTGDLVIDLASVHIQTNIGSIKPTGLETPEPASLFLMGTGLLGAGRIVRKRFQR